MSNLKLGVKAYRPRKPHTIVSWEAISAVIAKKGKISVSEAGKILNTSEANLKAMMAAWNQEHDTSKWHEAKKNDEGKYVSNAGFRTDHRDFINYLVRGKYLAEVK